MVPATLAPWAVLVVVAGTDLWVYLDAKRCADEGAPVTVRLGALVIAAPIVWLIACLVLWIVAFPMYVLSRTRQW